MAKLILIVLDGFPKLSETFVLNHIISLKKLGYRTCIMANRKIEGPCHPIVSEYKLLRETTFRTRIPLRRFRRLIVFCNYIIKVFLRNPGAGFRSLNRTKYGKSALNGELIISLYPYLKISKPSLIHCHFGPNGILAEKVVSVLKWDIPLFVSFHGFDTVGPNLADKDYARLFEKASRVFANSNFLKRKIIELGCNPNKVSVIPVGVLNSEPKHCVEKAAGQFIFVTVGRLIEVKGVEYSLKAFRLFKEENPKADFHYIIVGDGELRKDHEALTIELELQNNVTFTGAVTAEVVNEYLRKASVFILTGITTGEGRAESQGLVYQEAAIHGLPLIASDAGGVPEYVIDHKTGLIAREKDVEDIKEKIKKLYFDAELRADLGRNSKIYAECHFDQMELTKKMVAICESNFKNL